MIAFGIYPGEIASNPGSVKLVDFWKGLLTIARRLMAVCGLPDKYSKNFGKVVDVAWHSPALLCH
jgi:hypothetical protein